MKNIVMNIYLLLFTGILITGCEESILDKKPIDSYSDPIVWSDINLTKLYLNQIYDNIIYGEERSTPIKNTGIYALEMLQGKGGATIIYNSGQINADNLGNNRGQLNWKGYKQVQQINVFLENIENVLESTPETEKASMNEKIDVLKGEAFFLRAYFYHELCRSYGGVPLFDKTLKLSDDFSSITRATFEETINFIITDLDKASGLLKVKDEMEMGRATKEAAMALKSRMLLFAASDLTADGNAENELVGYKNPDREKLWKAAREAAKVLIDLGTTSLADFGAPDQEAVVQNYFNFFKAKDLSNDEVIWGRMYRKDVGPKLWANKSFGANGNGDFGNEGPTGNYVDLYQMNDGSKFFDHFIINENNDYINNSTTFKNENPYYDREPRFYATVLYDSAIWQPRFDDLVDIDPLGIYDRRTRIKIVDGVKVNERFGIDTRNGPVQSWNGGYGGYLMKKGMDDNIIGRDEGNENIVIYMRYAETILNYAEACLELGDINTATTYINLIRNRAGLPNFTGDVNAALRQERKIELFGENLVWYDLRRWKSLEEVLSQIPYGVDITEINEDGKIRTTWKKIKVQDDNNFDKKLYWIPISTIEINKSPQLIQNPGY